MHVQIRTWSLGKRLALGIPLGCLGAYALAGYVVLPWILQNQLPPRLSRILKRQVSLARVKTDPFALSITLDGFLVKDLDGKPFLGWDHLYVKAAAAALFGRTVSLSTVQLVHPYGRVILAQNGRFNFSDLLEPGPAAPQPQAPPLDLRIQRLAIQRAEISFTDQTFKTPFTTTLGPLDLNLTQFRTLQGKPGSFKLAAHTEAGESLAWEGEASLLPLASRGHFWLDHLALQKYKPYFQDRVAFDLLEGKMALSASYTFEWRPGIQVLKVHDGALDLMGLRIAPSNSQAPVVELPSTEVRGIRADLTGRTLGIDSLTLRDGKVKVVHLADGSLNLQQLFTPRPQPASPETQPFKVDLGEFRLQHFQASVEDKATSRPVKAEVRDLDLSLKHLNLDPGNRPDLALSMTLNNTARLACLGTVAPQEQSADLEVHLQNLPLAPFDPYLEPNLAARVKQGTLTLDGHTAIAGKTRALALSGDLRLDNLEVMDAARNEPFLRYRGLQLKGLDVKLQPGQVSQLNLRDVEMTGHEYRLVLAEDGTSNVTRALKLDAPAPVQAAGPLGSALGAALPAEASPSFAITIQNVHMTQGQLTFVDRSLEPNAVLRLSDLEGTNTGLSTTREGKSQLTLRGQAGESGPLVIQGRAMPLQHDKDTDVAITIRGANLTDFSPYAQKFLGYTIREGKLDVDARVRIQDRKLQLDSKTRLDHFYLGDKVESPDATHLPVKLGLALLRDRHGIIDLELPVGGSLDDPDIHYGPMVFKAILNALGKAAASPFTLLSKLCGSEADLSHATFPAGSSTLEPQETQKLATLVKALHDRPELRIEVDGTADPVLDGAALKRERLENLLQLTRVEARKAWAKLPEREQRIRSAFAHTFPAPQAEAPEPSLQEMEQRLLDSVKITSADLKELADARTQAGMALLIQTGGLEASRVFVVEDAKATGNGIFFTLK